VREKVSASIMTLKERIKFLISVPAVPQNVAKREFESVRGIVGLHSHGNIFLQRGRFYTKRDVDARYEKIAKVKFYDCADPGQSNRT
jgi:hypothetical protein